MLQCVHVGDFYNTTCERAEWNSRASYERPLGNIKRQLVCYRHDHSCVGYQNSYFLFSPLGYRPLLQPPKYVAAYQWLHRKFLSAFHVLDEPSRAVPCRFQKCKSTIDNAQYVFSYVCGVGAVFHTPIRHISRIQNGSACVRSEHYHNWHTARLHA